MARLQEKYSKEVAPALMEKYSYKSVMQIPKLWLPLKSGKACQSAAR